MIEVIDELCSVIKTQTEIIAYLSAELLKIRELTKAEQAMVDFADQNQEPLK